MARFPHNPHLLRFDPAFIFFSRLPFNKRQTFLYFAVDVNLHNVRNLDRVATTALLEEIAQCRTPWVAVSANPYTLPAVIKELDRY
jgi:hypothetical protein